MKQTCLYVKTHNHTGLKYFGKTTQDPYRYQGSGLYWARHLRAHGNDVHTEILGWYTDRILLEQDALAYSKLYDIVNSPGWANMKPENGLDGGFYHTPELHQKYREAWIERRKRPISDTTRQKLSDAKRGKTSGAKGKRRSQKAIQQALETTLLRRGGFGHTEETKAKMRKPKPEGHGAKVSAALKGKPKSPETRLKLSLALKRYYENKSSSSSR